MSEYAFLTDMHSNYGHLDDPRELEGPLTTEDNDPLLLQYYAVELNHAIKRALYCIVSTKFGKKAIMWAARNVIDFSSR